LLYITRRSDGLSFGYDPEEEVWLQLDPEVLATIEGTEHLLPEPVASVAFELGTAVDELRHTSYGAEPARVGETKYSPKQYASLSFFTEGRHYTETLVTLDNPASRASTALKANEHPEAPPLPPSLSRSLQEIANSGMAVREVSGGSSPVVGSWKWAAKATLS